MEDVIAGAGELQEIMDAVVRVWGTVDTPADEQAIALVADEPPDVVAVFPAVINVEDESLFPGNPSSGRTIVHTLNMHLLFAPAGGSYSFKSRRKWIKPVMDAFDANVNLLIDPADAATRTCQRSMITRVLFNPVSWNGQEYIAATFILGVTTAQTMAFTAASA